MKGYTKHVIALVLVLSVNIPAAASPRAPTPKLMDQLGRKQVRLSSFVDPAFGVAEIDLFMGPDGSPPNQPRLVCGFALPDALKRWQRQITDGVQDTRANFGEVACGVGFGGWWCRLGATAEYDPAFYYIFFSGRESGLRLGAIVKLDEVLVDDDGEGMRKAQSLAADLTSRRCPAGESIVQDLVREGRADEEKRSHRSAVRRYQQALAINPRAEEPLYLLAREMAREKRYAEALDLLARLHEADTLAAWTALKGAPDDIAFGDLRGMAAFRVIVRQD